MSPSNQMAEAVNQTGAFHFLSMKHEFGTEFHKFLHPARTAEHMTTLTLSKQLFPFVFQGKQIDITNVIVVIILRDTTLYNNISEAERLRLTISRNGQSDQNEPLEKNGPETLGDKPQVLYTGLSGPMTENEDWVLSVSPNDMQSLTNILKDTLTIDGIPVTIDGTPVERIKAEEVEDIGIFLQYEVS